MILINNSTIIYNFPKSFYGYRKKDIFVGLSKYNYLSLFEKEDCSGDCYSFSSRGYVLYIVEDL